MTAANDDRVQPGAYITNEIHMFEVLDKKIVNGGFKKSKAVVIAENCLTGENVEIDIALVRSSYRLVTPKIDPTALDPRPSYSPTFS